MIPSSVVGVIAARGVRRYRDLKRFDAILEQDIANYDGNFKDLIKQAPALYRLMTRLLDDSSLPRKMSQQVIAAIAYFILPGDVIPEDKYGPLGYVDDIYLCAFVANKVMVETGSEEILDRNWDGNTPVLPLISEILNREREMIGDKKESIMQYIGYDQLGTAQSNNFD
jgi:uncharacterized membrane protein YkvA (DUF1232 family)